MKPTPQHTPRKNRSTRLITEFVDGYAQGWHFAVHKAFQDQLDIKLTERVVDGKKQLTWTQGQFYCFDEGHLIYSAINPKISCQVQRAVPAQINSDNKLVHGSVTFTLSQYHDHSPFDKRLGLYQLTQFEFVEFLRTGEMPEGGAILEGEPPPADQPQSTPGSDRFPIEQD